jgi:cytochrome c oxidase cbb3-type subunit 3
MSDFTHDFWHWFVAALTLLGIVACLILLWFSGKTRAMTANDNTTGHVWDGDLRELNNPLPRWWVGLFVLTVIFALMYLAFYPGLGYFGGKFSWSSAAQYSTEVERARQKLAPMYERFDKLTPEQISADPQAMAIGDSLFMNHCAQCHGSDGRGSKGFPNLIDADWLYGGSFDRIRETITQGRIGNMPPMAAAVGSPEDVRNVAHYVLSLSGSPHDSLRAALGKTRFGACAACHGMDGKGNHALGAPNLTDDIWLHGWGEKAIVDIVTKGKANAMPAQADKLTEGQIQVLTSYVWGLSRTRSALAMR